MGDADYLVLGSYEGHLVGYRLGDQATAKESTAQERRDATETSFALKAHDGCVRAVASGGAYLATCGSDHSISVYNLRRLREHGKLVQQEGGTTLHCLSFFGDSHLVSGGGDGELCIWRASDWECLLRMKGHNGLVHAVAIHPSGRAALSVAADGKLMLWNLTTGKCNYTTSLKEPAYLISWSPDGESYLYSHRRGLLLHALRSDTLIHELPHIDAPPLAATFCTDLYVLSGDDKGSFKVWNAKSGSCVVDQGQAHDRRIKAVTVIPSRCESANQVQWARTIATASSDGVVALWRLTHCSDEDRQASLHELYTITTSLRITCLAASAPTNKRSNSSSSTTAGAVAGSHQALDSNHDAKRKVESSKTHDVAQMPPDEVEGLPAASQRKKNKKKA